MHTARGEAELGDRSRTRIACRVEGREGRSQGYDARFPTLIQVELWSRDVSEAQHHHLRDRDLWAEVMQVAEKHMCTIATEGVRGSVTAAVDFNPWTWRQDWGPWEGTSSAEADALWLTLRPSSQATPPPPRALITTASTSAARAEQPAPRPRFANGSPTAASALLSQGDNWVMYPLDISSRIEAAFLHFLTDPQQNSVIIDSNFSDSRHVSPVTGQAQYVIWFSETAMNAQQNTMSGFTMKVERIPVDTDDDLPPHWTNYEAQQGWQASAMVPDAAPAPGRLVHVVGFHEQVDALCPKLDLLLTRGVRFSQRPIPLPHLITLKELQGRLRPALSRMYSADLLPEPCGRAVKVRAIGDWGLAEAEKKVHAFFVDCLANVVPEHWSKREVADGDEPVAFVTLPSNSREYQDVAARVLKGVDHSILSIVRVENPLLYRKYVMQQRAIALENGGDPNLRVLLHGTRASCPGRICRSTHGLCVQYSDGSSYGRATYLTPDMEYIERHKFHHQLANGHRQVLVVEAALGRVEARPFADQHIRVPATGHHSVTGPVGYSLHRAYMKYESYH